MARLRDFIGPEQSSSQIHLGESERLGYSTSGLDVCLSCESAHVHGVFSEQTVPQSRIIPSLGFGSGRMPRSRTADEILPWLRLRERPPDPGDVRHCQRTDATKCGGPGVHFDLRVKPKEFVMGMTGAYYPRTKPGLREKWTSWKVGWGRQEFVPDFMNLSLRPYSTWNNSRTRADTDMRFSLLY